MSGFMSSVSSSPLAMPTPKKIAIHQEEHSLQAKPKIGVHLECCQRIDDDAKKPRQDHSNTSNSHSTPPSLFILSFNNLTYSLKNKVLLDNASGEAKEGEILAFLGPCGSGKSTLIDALADRISKDSLKGTTTFNGEPLESKTLRAISAYVMQDDLLFPMLTVEETLMFAAEFRLPRSLSKARKQARVIALIKQLGLQSTADTMIGDEGHRGISGGEKRRVSIGIEIIHDPILLFLDEPTSGLDSTCAFMVVKVLKNIALSGSTVIMSIHQPSFKILGLLDSLIFLSRGQTVYSGVLDHIPKYFAELREMVPENENRAEFVLDLILQLEESPGGIQKLVDFNKIWQNRRCRWTNKSISLKQAISISISKGKLTINDDQNPSSVPAFANPIWVEMYVIAKRSVLNSLRMPELFGIRFGVVLLTGIILATMFWRPDASPRGADDRVSFFVLAISTTFYTCAEALPKFVEQKFIFERETAFQAYRRTSYVLSHTFTAIPALVLLSFTFTLITFWAVGLAGGGGAGYLSYFLFILTAFWAGHSFVTFISGIVTHVILGYAAVLSILVNFVLFSGFFVSRNRIPAYWLWFHYATMVKYPYQGVLQSEFGGPRAERCFAKGWEMFDATPLQAAPEELKAELLESINAVLGGEVNITRSSCVMTGMDVLKRQGVDDLSKWSCLWITIAWGILFRVMFYLALMFGNKNKRK